MASVNLGWIVTQERQAYPVAASELLPRRKTPNDLDGIPRQPNASRQGQLDVALFISFRGISKPSRQ